MKLEGTRFVMSPGGSALGLPEGEYWAVHDKVLREAQVELAAALARAEAAELENRAWRALAEWEREPETYRAVAWEYDPAPLVSASGDAGAYETAMEPTVQDAAMALAAKLGLINPEPGAKGEGVGER